MSYEFKPGKYKTRDGRCAVVLGMMPEPFQSAFRLCGGILQGHGVWSTASWKACGHYRACGDCGSDLMPPITTRWAGVYGPDVYWTVSEDVKTDRRCHDDLAGVIRLDFQGGKLVSVKLEEEE